MVAKCARWQPPPSSVPTCLGGIPHRRRALAVRPGIQVAGASHMGLLTIRKLARSCTPKLARPGTPNLALTDSICTEDSVRTSVETMNNSKQHVRGGNKRSQHSRQTTPVEMIYNGELVTRGSFKQSITLYAKQCHLDASGHKTNDLPCTRAPPLPWQPLAPRPHSPSVRATETAPFP
jgi:hypothetical protein